MFYDLYTIVDDKPVLLSSSGERDRYYWRMDGTIAEYGSSSALESSWYYYRFEGDELILKESILFLMRIMMKIIRGFILQMIRMKTILCR